MFFVLILLSFCLIKFSKPVNSPSQTNLHRQVSFNFDQYIDWNSVEPVLDDHHNLDRTQNSPNQSKLILDDNNNVQQENKRKRTRNYSEKTKETRRRLQTKYWRKVQKDPIRLNQFQEKRRIREGNRKKNMTEEEKANLRATENFKRRAKFAENKEKGLPTDYCKSERFILTQKVQKGIATMKDQERLKELRKIDNLRHKEARKKRNQRKQQQQQQVHTA